MKLRVPLARIPYLIAVATAFQPAPLRRALHLQTARVFWSPLACVPGLIAAIQQPTLLGAASLQSVRTARSMCEKESAAASTAPKVIADLSEVGQRKLVLFLGNGPRYQYASVPGKISNIGAFCSILRTSLSLARCSTRGLQRGRKHAKMKKCCGYGKACPLCRAWTLCAIRILQHEEMLEEL